MKEYKAITPGLRHRKITKRNNLTKERPIKELTKGQGKSNYRNQRGRITVRHRGGGHKRSIRKLYSYERENKGIYIVERIEYDPNRSANIALIKTQEEIGIKIRKQENTAIREGKKYIYVVANKEWKPGDRVREITQEIGKIPEGTKVNNIEWKYARGAGTSGVIIKKEGEKVTIRMPSKKIMEIRGKAIAMIGEVGNEEEKKRKRGKAGAARWEGERPRVRGEVMNPIDHPHGGKTRGGRPIKNIWGKLAKWVPTGKKRGNK